MAVWDELRVILTRLRDQQPAALLQWPDPRDEQGRPPPFQITLAPSAGAVAEDLHRRFGDSVVLTVGCLPYPPGRQPDRPLDHLTRQPPGELLDPHEAEISLDGPATVGSGRLVQHLWRDYPVLINRRPGETRKTHRVCWFAPPEKLRDTLYQEDKSKVRTRSGPRIMAALRNLAIGALRLAGRADITEATRWAGRFMDRPFTILGLTS
jgi:hypothetical protein